MRKNFLYIVPILFFFAACDVQSADYYEIEYHDTNDYEAIHEEDQHEPDDYEAGGDTNLQPAIINVNDQQMSFYGYFDGLFHFRLQDIEDMVRGTRSRFRYAATPQDEWRDYHILRGATDIPAWFADMEVPSYEADNDNAIIREQVAMWTPFPYRDGALGYIYALKIGGQHYFALCSLAAVLGFTIDYAEDGAAWIDTHEANISEYGRQVAAQFLSEMPTLFYLDWSEHTLETTPFTRPWGYFQGEGEEHELYSRFYPAWFELHDFNGNGIPDFLIRYSGVGWQGELLQSKHLFMYIDGAYQEVMVFWAWGGIFADAHGSIFTMEGTHQTGFARAQRISFDNVGRPIVEMIVEPFWMHEDYSDEAWEEHWERYWYNWDYFAPIVPGQPDEPMVAVRPIWDLAESLKDEVAQRLVAEGRMPE